MSDGTKPEDRNSNRLGPSSSLSQWITWTYSVLTIHERDIRDLRSAIWICTEICTQNLQSEFCTQNLQSELANLKSEIRQSELWTLNAELWTLDALPRSENRNQYQINRDPHCLIVARGVLDREFRRGRWLHYRRYSQARWYYRPHIIRDRVMMTKYSPTLTGNIAET